MVATAIRTISPSLMPPTSMSSSMWSRGCWAGSSASWRRCCATLLAFTAFPVSHWKKVWSTNPLERLNTAATYTTPRDVTRCVVRAQLLLAERSDSGRAQAANATGYLLADLRPPAHWARTGRADIGGTHSLPGSECDTAPMMAPSQVLAGVRRRIERAVADGAPEQLKCLLDSVVEQIVVEYRACIQPYFVAPTVRTRIRPRRRTGIEPAWAGSLLTPVLKIWIVPRMSTAAAT
jgi:hypothetical protein